MDDYTDEQRIAILSELFQELAAWECHALPSDCEDTTPYMAMYYVEKILPAGLYLEADHGHRIGPLRISHEIASLIRTGDAIVITAARFKGVWHLTSFDFMLPTAECEIDYEGEDEFPGLH